jgi:hypothetical protein
MGKVKVGDRWYSRRQVKKNIKLILADTLRATKEDTIDWIRRYVPKRTGQLQEDLIAWIDKNWVVDNEGLQISIGSKIEYAGDIKGEPAHAATWFEHSGRRAVANYGKHEGRIFLDDPEAIADWHITIKDFIKEKVVNYINSYKSIYFGG